MGPVLRRLQVGFALSLFAFIGLSLPMPAAAHDVSVVGDVTFASLDGSAADHDGAADGVFTVDDGSLFVTGTIRCDDLGPGVASACPMVFDVAGDLVVEAGGALRAQNLTGPGAGGDVELWVDGELVLEGAAGLLPGAVVTSGRTSSAPGAAGAIRVTTGGAVTVGAGATVSASTPGGTAGAIEIDAGGPLSLDGRVFSGPSDTLAAAPAFGEALVGGTGTQRGGPIALRSAASVAIGGSAYVVSQGHNPGADRVLVEGCGVAVRGLVASLSRDGGPSRVVVRSGEGILVDGRDLDGEFPTSGRFGQLRADGTQKGAGGFSVHLLAASDVTVLGPSGTAAPFAVSSDPGGQPHGQGGSVVVTSTAGSIAASGRAARAGVSGNGHDGGWIDLKAAHDVIVDGATLHANGNLGSGAAGTGGAIVLRAHQGEVSWVLGAGDARPVGTGASAGDQGAIILIYCTTVDTAGTSFPTTGSPIPPYPAVVQLCSPPAPSLPPGEPPLPVCNQPPVADDQAVTTDEDTPVTIVLTGSDPDGDPLTFTIVDPPDHGGLGPIVPTGPTSAEVEYTPDPDYFGPDELTFQVDDGNGGTDTGTVTITVDPVNDAPVANDDSATVAEGGTVGVLDSAEVSVLANDTDADGDPLTAILVSGPAHASAFTLNADGTFSYTHDGGTDASDAFTYRANDGTTDSNVATVTITITQVDDPPVANDDAYALDEGGTLVEPAPGVLGNDTDDEGAALTAVLVSGPAHASSFTLNADGSFSYTHDGSETTSDSFTYQANDGANASNTATVTITVNPVDDPPVAADDAYAVDEGGILIEPAPGVLGNDTDAEGATLTAILVSGPAHASSFTLNPDGSFDYTHDGSETTSDSFTYMANDGSLDSNVATVTITVDPVNDAPVADDDAYAVDEGGTLNEPAPGVLDGDTDAEGDSLTAVLFSAPANASSFALNADGSFSYTHDGSETTSDSFTYKANDGTADSNVATVTITVTAVDDPPVAVADFPMVIEDSGATALTVLANDTDADGGAKEITAFSDPANGTVVGVGGGPFTDVTYQPDPNYCNSMAGPSATPDTFTYTLNGGSMATVSVTVICVNDAPVAGADAFDFVGNTELRVDHGAAATPHALETTTGGTGLLENDSDPVEGDPVSIVGLTVDGCIDNSAPFDCTDPDVGRVELDADGSFSFVPAAGDGGATETFQYTLSDGTTTTMGTVTLTRHERVWYVNNDAAPGGDGTSTLPFDAITAANLNDNDGDADLTDDLDSAGDYLFVYFGDGTDGDLSGGLFLEGGQHLIGEHAGLSLPVNLNGNGSPTTLVAAAPGNRPLLDDNVADGFDGVVARDVVPAEITGMSLAGDTNAIDWTTTAAFAGAGTYTIRDSVVRSAGAEGVDLNLAGTSNVGLAFHDNTITSTGTALDLQETGTGSVTITAFDDLTVNGNTGGSGIVVNNAVFDSVPGGGLDTVSGGTWNVGAPGNGVGLAGMMLSNVQGDLHFTNLNVHADSGTGLGVTGTGVAPKLRVNTGGAATGIIQATNGPAVSAGAIELDLRLVDLDSTNSTSQGVSLTNVTGTFTAESGSHLQNATGTDFLISGGTATVTYKGTITDDVGQLVSVSGATGGTKSFEGAITDNDDGDGSGISLSANGGATIRFSGGLVLSTGGNAAFAATGGGTVAVCDENPCNGAATGGLINKITTTTGTALNVANTSIASQNLEFRSISAGTGASGPANGIVVNNTGAAGGLKVKGTGGAGTGGTIQRTTGDGISLTSTQHVELSHMIVTNGGEDGLDGSSVNNFALTSSSVTNNGNAANEEGISFSNLSGTASLSSVTATGNAYNNLRIDNTTGTLSSLAVTGGSYSNNSSTTGNHGILMEIKGSSALTSGTISGATIADNFSIGLQAVAGDTATVSSLTITNNTFTGTLTGATTGSQEIAVDCSKAQTSSMTCSITNNLGILNHNSHAINVSTAAGAGTGGTFNARITGNTIGAAGTAFSGSNIGNGIRVSLNGDSSNRVLVASNTIRQFPNGRGIEVIGRNGVGGSDVTVTGNIVDGDFQATVQNGGAELASIVVQSNCVTVCNTVRSDVRNNNVSAATDVVDFSNTHIILVESSTSTLQLVDTTAPVSGTCATELAATNTGSTSVVGGCSLIAGPINTPP
jgi:VCBS repeat-containing protein